MKASRKFIIPMTIYPTYAQDVITTIMPQNNNSQNQKTLIFLNHFLIIQIIIQKIVIHHSQLILISYRKKHFHQNNTFNSTKPRNYPHESTININIHSSSADELELSIVDNPSLESVILFTNRRNFSFLISNLNNVNPRKIGSNKPIYKNLIFPHGQGHNVTPMICFRISSSTRHILSAHKIHTTINTGSTAPPEQCNPKKLVHIFNIDLQLACTNKINDSSNCKKPNTIHPENKTGNK